MASNEAHLRASEIKDVLLREIERYEEDLQVEEVGEVLEVKDGVARIYGLTNAMASEMLEITSSESGEAVTALALNLEEDNIGAVVMGDWTLLHEGDVVRRTGRVLDIPVGAGYIGLEVAAVAREHGAAVTVVETASAPLQAARAGRRRGPAPAAPGPA